MVATRSYADVRRKGGSVIVGGVVTPPLMLDQRVQPARVEQASAVETAREMSGQFAAHQGADTAGSGHQPLARRVVTLKACAGARRGCR